VRRPESGAILLVADLFHPIDVFAVEPFSNEDSSSLLGGLLVTTLGLAAYTRVDTPSANRRDFFVYIDEFQSLTTLALANMLSELRKYRVGFTIAISICTNSRLKSGTPCSATLALLFLSG